MQCITPFTVFKKTGNVTLGTKQSIAVPCGKCPACKKRRASSWSFRLVQEEKRSLSANFITLTYATENLPFTENGYMDIRKDELQRFFKRLRKLQKHRDSYPDYFNPNPVKYYACGEFGGKTGRPHYHIILFNAKLDTIQEAWSLEDDKGIRRAIGEVHYGEVNPKSINYSLKYISKDSRVGKSPEDDRTKEFALMSKGLGENYLTDAMVNWHNADAYKRMYCNLTDGKKVAMPRYYKDRIYAEDHRKTIGVKERQRIITQEDKQIQKNPNYYRDRFEGHKAMIRNDKIEQSKNDKL